MSVITKAFDIDSFGADYKLNKQGRPIFLFHGSLMTYRQALDLMLFAECEKFENKKKYEDLPFSDLQYEVMLSIRKKKKEPLVQKFNKELQEWELKEN